MPCTHVVPSNIISKRARAREGTPTVLLRTTPSHKSESDAGLARKKMRVRVFSWSSTVRQRDATQDAATQRNAPGGDAIHAVRPLPPSPYPPIPSSFLTLHLSLSTLSIYCPPSPLYRPTLSFVCSAALTHSVRACACVRACVRVRMCMCPCVRARVCTQRFPGLSGDMRRPPGVLNERAETEKGAVAKNAIMTVRGPFFSLLPLSCAPLTPTHMDEHVQIRQHTRARARTRTHTHTRERERERE